MAPVSPRRAVTTSDRLLVPPKIEARPRRLSAITPAQPQFKERAAPVLDPMVGYEAELLEECASRALPRLAVPPFRNGIVNRFDVVCCFLSAVVQYLGRPQ